MVYTYITGKCNSCEDTETVARLVTTESKYPIQLCIVCATELVLGFKKLAKEQEKETDAKV